MTLTLFEAAKLSRNPLTRGVLTAIAETDELLSQIPMVSMPGSSFMYDREKSLPGIEFVAPNHTSLLESSATFDQVTVPMRLIASNIDVMNFSEEQQGDTNGQKAVQIQKKLKALGRTIGQRLITGNYAAGIVPNIPVGGVTFTDVGPNQDTGRHGPALLRFTLANAGLGGVPTLEYQGPQDRTYGAPLDVSADGSFVLLSDNPSKNVGVAVVAASLPAADAEFVLRISSTTEEWDGLPRLISDGQTIGSTGAAGDPLTLELMDCMIDEKIKERDNLRFIFPAKAKTAYYSIIRSLGGIGIETTVLAGVNGPVPTYRGIPILQSDWIPLNESKGGVNNLTSIYLASLSPNSGFWLATSAAGGAQNVDIDPRQARVMGVQLRDLGQLENKDATRTRVTFYGATALGSDLSAVRASELAVVAP